jgi:uncharacterized protein YjbI with pentapeptide repeats
MGDPEQAPPKMKAEDNRWYLLATLYGVPEFQDDELKNKNRDAWNRYFAANLDEETRARLITEKLYSKEELTSFSSEELREVEAAFAKRCEAPAKSVELPCPNSQINFSGVEFDRVVFFEKFLLSHSYFVDATFSRGALFSGATFFGAALFNDTHFSTALFRDATFAKEASFHGATFSGVAEFQDATFAKEASFQGATFFNMAMFQCATFARDAQFGLVTISEEAMFDGTIFSGNAIFDGAIFSREAVFDRATFSGVANFCVTKFHASSSFVNAEIKGETYFEIATFKTAPPKFFVAKLHQGTVWRGITWPPVPNSKREAGQFIDAYACLKLEMNRLKKHEDELNFFALELQSRRVEQGLVRGLPIALYGLLSDYGRSYVWPLLWLFAVAAFGAAIFRHFGALTLGESSGLSAANTLNVFGFRKDFFSDSLNSLPWGLDFLAAVQTILGTILLFLFGLGIRNKFRMK